MEMRTSMIVTMALVLLFIAISATAASAIPCNCGDICVNTSGWWQDSGGFNASDTPIQHAIDYVTEGDTVCVKDGTYNENVDVNKCLTIRSENGSASTTVQASDSNNHVFNVGGDYVNISGFTMTGATGFSMAGVCLANVSNNEIKENEISNNTIGLYLQSSSSNNTITNNSMNSNNWYGISIECSSNNTLTNNSVKENNEVDVDICAYLDSHCNNIIEDNTGSGDRPIKYFNHSVNLQNEILSELILCNADYSNINNVTIIGSETKDNNGIYASYTDNSNFTNINSSNNCWGILLWDSHNNTVTGNLNYNYAAGIRLFGSNNTLTNNTAKENSHQDIWLDMLPDSECNNIIEDNTGSGDRPIKYFNHSIDLQNEILSELILCNADYSNINNVTIIGSETKDNNGIYASFTDNSNFTNINSSNNDRGIRLYSSSNNTLINNTVNSNRWCGIDIGGSSNNTIINNTAKENNKEDVAICAYLDSHCNNIIENNTGSGDRPIKYFNHSVNLQNEILSELILCNADYSNINNVTIIGSETKDNNGLYAFSTDNSNFSNINSSNNYDGIDLSGANNTLINNIANSNSRAGIDLSSSTNNILSNSTANSNGWYGIILGFSFNNTLINNTAKSNNHYGIYIRCSSNNKIYNNYFNNTNNVHDDGNNIWNITAISGTNIISGPYLGGNYWSNYEGEDTNEDGIGNTLLPYNNGIATGGDWLPLTPTNVSVETSTGTGTTTFSTDSGEFADINSVDEDSLPEEARDNKPGNLTLSHGLFNFTITGLTPGQSVNLTITLPSPVPVGWKWWKVNTTAGNNTWYSLQIGDDNGDNVVTITLIDGGLGDNDGIVNGAIVDPGGLGAVSDITPPASISNLTNITGQTWINWTWTNPADDDFNHTMVYLEGTWKINTSDPFYNATGITPDTYYEIGTHTVDEVGNINETWVNQTTKAKAPAVIPANIVIKPETLNLKSKGEFTAFITLPEPYNITDINISTVVCEDAPAVKGVVADDNKYIAKFDRGDLQEDLQIGDEVTLTVTGNLYDGNGLCVWITPFEGSDTIRVIGE